MYITERNIPQDVEAFIEAEISPNWNHEQSSIQHTTLSYRYNVQEDPKLLLSNIDL